MKTLLLILLLSIAAFGQKLPKEIEVKYDKFKDETKVTLTYGHPAFDRLIRTFSFEFEGQKLTENADIFYLYALTSSRACSTFCFDRSTSFIFLADDKRLTFENPHNALLGNYVFFVLTRKQLQQLASAQVIEYQVGKFEGKWKQNDIDKLKILLDLATVK